VRQRSPQSAPCPQPALAKRKGEKQQSYDDKSDTPKPKRSRVIAALAARFEKPHGPPITTSGAV
jgi:hypothetical protein